MRVTIKKIADIAKVSRGTVDKVLNSRPGVSDEVRERVKQIATTLNYKPNIIGKALANQNKPITIGIVITSDDNPYYTDVKRGIDAAYQEYKDFGIKIEFAVMQITNEEEQLKAINKLLDKGISALVINAVDHEAVRDSINRVIDSRIPVVTFISDIIGTNRMCFVGHDLLKGGRVAGQLMGKLINGEGKVAIITGPYNLLAHKLRTSGFEAVIENEYKNIEIVQKVDNNDNDSISFELTYSLLESIKNLKGLYITGGGVEGAGKAIKLLGMGGKIKVICFDFVPETIKLAKEGIIDFAIGQDPFFEGYKPVKVLCDYFFTGQLPETNQIFTKVDIRVKENIDM